LKKIPFEEFEALLKPIKSYLEDLDRSNKAIDQLCPSSYATIDLGSNLLDSYIDVASKYIEDDSHWIDWFTFENEFGKKKYECGCLGKMYKIKNEKDLYDFMLL